MVMPASCLIWSRILDQVGQNNGNVGHLDRSDRVGHVGQGDQVGHVGQGDQVGVVGQE